MCQGDIKHKIHLQQQNWREIGHHICDKVECNALFAYVHSTVVGLPHPQQNYLQPYNQPTVQPVPQIQHVQPEHNSGGFLMRDSNVMDAECAESYERKRIQQKK